MDERLARLAERYKQLDKEGSDYHSRKGLAIYGAIAGGLMFVSGILFPNYSDGTHPMLLTGVGLTVAIVAGIYLVIQRDAEKERDREIRSIEAEFTRKNMKIWTGGRVDTAN